MADYFWDFDGTLYDTYRGMVKAFVEACAACKCESVDPLQVYRAMRRTSLHQTFNVFLKTADAKMTKMIIAKYESLEHIERADALPFDGAVEVCRWVIEQGGRNFLVTHRDRSACDLLERDQLADYFAGYVTSEDKFPRKPDPTSLNFLCGQYHVDREDAFMVGDRTLDIEAAHRAGMRGILFDPDGTIRTAIVPDKRIKSLREIVKAD